MDYRKELVRFANDYIKLKELYDAGAQKCLIQELDDEMYFKALLIREELKKEPTKCEKNKCKGYERA